MQKDWQLLYLNGVPLHPKAAVDQAQAELGAVEADCKATRIKQLKGYGSKARATSQDAQDRYEIPTKGPKQENVLKCKNYGDPI